MTIYEVRIAGRFAAAFRHLEDAVIFADLQPAAELYRIDVPGEAITIRAGERSREPELTPHIAPSG